MSKLYGVYIIHSYDSLSTYLSNVLSLTAPPAQVTKATAKLPLHETTTNSSKPVSIFHQLSASSRIHVNSKGSSNPHRPA